MLHLTAPVRDRQAKRHDAAIVQAALRLRQVSMGLRRGKSDAVNLIVDGDFGPKSQAALKNFMNDARLKGPLEVRPGGPVARALASALAHNRRELAAIETTNIVFVPLPRRPQGPAVFAAAGTDETDRRFQTALADLAARVRTRMGLRLTFHASNRSPGAPHQVNIHGEAAEWLFAGALRPARPREIPPVALERLRDLVLPLGKVSVIRAARPPHLHLLWRNQGRFAASRFAPRIVPAVFQRWGLTSAVNSSTEGDKLVLNEAVTLLEEAARAPAKAIDAKTMGQLRQITSRLRAPQNRRTLESLLKGLSDQRTSSTPMEDAARFALRETLATARAVDSFGDIGNRFSTAMDSLVVVEEINGIVDIGAFGVAIYADTALLEALILTGNRFDLKPKMRNLFGNRTEHFDPISGYLFPFDIWSNIQWGYAGAKLMLEIDHLLERGNQAQKIHSRTNDPSHDQAAIQLGNNLWHTYKDALSANQFLQELRDSGSRLGRLTS